MQKIEIEQAHPMQYEIWSKMDANQKYELFEQLMSDVRAIKTAAVKQAEPRLTDAEVSREVAQIFMYART